MREKMKSLPVMLVLCLTLLTACDRKDHVIWSPDGARVAIVASDGLRVGNETGEISAPLISKADICRWLPDSVHAVVVSTNPTTRWSDVKDLLSYSERLKVLRIAESMWRSRSVSNRKSIDALLVSDALIYLKYKYGAKPVKAKLA